MTLYKVSWSYKANDDGYAEATDEDVLEHPVAEALKERAERAEKLAAERLGELTAVREEIGKWRGYLAVAENGGDVADVLVMMDRLMAALAAAKEAP